MSKLKNLFCAAALAVAVCTGVGAPFAEREVTAPREGWRMLNGAAALALSGEDVSRPGFDDAAWMPAVVPGTVLATLVRNGRLPDPYWGLNNEISRALIPDVSTNRTFYTAWFRTAFGLPAAGEGRVVWMRPEGINYRAEIWLNGRLAAVTGGMFARNAVDVTAFVQPGRTNALAVKVFPVDHPGTCRPKAWGAAGEWHNGGDGEIGRDVTMLMSAGWDFTFPDGVRDRNTGIWKDIAFFETGLVRLDAPYVRTKLNAAMDAAELTLEVDLHNAVNGWGKEVAGELTAEVEGTDVRFAKRVTLFRGERRTERMTATLKSPKLWWPRNKGPQSLYTLRARFADAKTGRVSDAVQMRFGVREVASDQSGRDGARQFYVNRKKIFIRGTNWIPEAMLKADDARMAEELRLTCDSGVNLVRLWAGGIAESDWFYQLCDEYGLLVWQEFWMTGDTRHPDDPGAYLDQVAQQVRRIRSHASLAHWTASNESTEVEGTEALVRRLTGTASWMMQSECDGVHDGSPYVPVNPMRHFRDEASDRGPRVYGFSPEYGTVALPSIDGIRRFMRDEDLWPMDAHEAAWKYRSGGGFDRLTTTHRALVEAYGPAASLEEYVRRAQAVDALQHQVLWEVWNRARNEATGVLFWYNNTPIPQLGSHAWDYFLEPTAAFFAQRNALEPLHAQYDYLTGDVWVSNDLPEARELTLVAEVYDFGTRKAWSRRAPVSVPAEAAVRAFRVEVPADITKVHFVKLRLLDAAGAELAQTFYWRSTDPYGGKGSLTGGAASGFESLPDLPATTLSVTREGVGWRVANTGSCLAFMVEVKPRRMTDNYFHLLPGESRHVEPTDGFRGVPSVSAWNVPRAAIAAAPTGLTTERRENPVGIDAPVPRLSWRLPDGVARQSAYELEIDGRPQGRVDSSESLDVAWPGGALATSRRVTWRVRVWDEAGRASDWSAPATFTMGVMRPEDWTAKWIGPAPETRPDFDFGAAQWITAPADAKGVTTLTCSFTFDGTAPGTCVEMVHAGVSQHEIRVNGRLFHKWAGHVHDWRYPHFRDLTPYLVKGTNTVAVRVFADRPRKASDPIDPIRVHAPKDVRAFLARIDFPDGRTRVTGADGWTSPGGPVTELGRVRETGYGRALKLRTETASPAFAKTFAVAKPVRAATLHVTGVGFYEAYLNGKKVGRKVLDPAPTDYAKRVLYSTYEVGSEVRPGANELKLLVGHGWYDLRSTLVWNFETAPWRDFPRCLAQLEIAYADGTTETVATDGSWRQVESPVGYDDLFEGEIAGAWRPKGPDFATADIRAAEVPGPGGRLAAEAQPGAEVVREIPVKRIVPFDGGCVLDFGENVVGWARLTLRGQAKGDVVSIRYDERVQPDGSPAESSASDGLHTFSFWNAKLADEAAKKRHIDRFFHSSQSHRVLPTADAAFQTDHFICSGAATETYEPRFAYHGFRYVVVRGLRAALKPTDVVARFVRTAFPTIGSFACSDDGFSRLMAAGVRAYESNFTDGVPTDCPHREKNGWTGDASIASEFAQYVFENTAGYEKWLRDVCDAQLPDGNIPCIVPTSGWGFHWGNGPAWDSALYVIPWNLWIYRGDRRILDEVYPHILRHLAYTATKADAQGLVRHGLGDWIPVDERHVPTVEYTSSCYYLQAQRIAAEVARVKGLADDAARLDAGAARTAAAIRAKYARGNGAYDNGGQTAQAFALAYGIVPDAERPAAEAQLVRAVARAGGRVDMGLLGTKHVFRALSRAGRTDLAWRMLTSPDSPSPMDWIRKGGTTLWEDWWDGSSRNHVMFGDFVGWAYQYLAGIRLAEASGSTSAVTVPVRPAFGELVVEPVFLKELDWLSASTVTPYGKVAVSWRRAGGTVAVEIAVPPGARAEIRLPNRPPQAVGTGTWRFDVDN